MSGFSHARDPVDSSLFDQYSLSRQNSNASPATQYPSHEPPFTAHHENRVDMANLSASSKQSLKAAMELILGSLKMDQDQDEDDEMDDEEESAVDLADQSMRTERLRRIAPALEQLWAHNSEYLVNATAKLADGSRNPKWRIPLGDSGILGSYLRILASHGTSETLLIHVLRLIGNSCADTDENREKVVAQRTIPAIIALFSMPSLLPFVIPVLFNICMDYEPAQKQASEVFLSKAIIDLMQSPSFSESRAFLGYICRLLDLLVAHPSEIENAPENTAIVLFALAVNNQFPVDIEDFLALSTSGMAYLQHPRFQEALLQQGGLDHALKILLTSYTRFEELSMSSPEDLDPDITNQLVTLRNNMNAVLSDISALPTFAAIHPVVSPLSNQLRRWLSSPQKQLQICACIMLGNVARSDATCIEFVHTSQIHKPLIAILASTHDPQLLHATLGFLKNLALPVQNKAIMGEANIIDPLERLWSLDSQPQIQYSSLSLVRQLCISCFANIERICGHLSMDQDSPAYQRSLLSLLLAIFNRTDAQPTKMEIARLFTAICRVFATYNDTVENQERRRRKFFEKHPDIGRAIAYMVVQKEWPVVRSEGWFVMALVARYPDGAAIIADIMHDSSVFQPLVELLTGKSFIDGTPRLGSPNHTPSTESSSSGEKAMTEKELEMQRIDRENALVLVSEVLKHRGSEMAPMRKSAFEDLLKGGGMMHMSWKQINDTERLLTGDKKGAIGTLVDPEMGLHSNEIIKDASDEIFS